MNGSEHPPERESFAERLERQSDDAAEAKFGVRPNGTEHLPEHTGDNYKALIEHLHKASFGEAGATEPWVSQLIWDARNAVEALVAENERLRTDLDTRFEHSDHQSAKYYKRMRDAERDADVKAAQRDSARLSADLYSQRLGEMREQAVMNETRLRAERDEALAVIQKVREAWEADTGWVDFGHAVTAILSTAPSRNGEHA